VLDRKWREHLYEMDYLQEGIGLRAMGQRDPLVEYQREGFTMFSTMMDAIKEESVAFLFNLEVQVGPAPEATDETSDVESSEEAVEEEPVLVAPGLDAPKRPSRLQYSAPTMDGDSGVEQIVEPGGSIAEESQELKYAGTPRNAKCPCGSGKAYKRCHGDPRHTD
jgi:preprotein translocase subunit SecA